MPPYEQWDSKYTVPVDVLLDGVLETDPEKGPFCYTSSSAFAYKSPYVKMEMSDVTKVERVRLLARDQYFSGDMDLAWGEDAETQILTKRIFCIEKCF